jgi:bifunctional NMN adenylyltransferase/nudix hydrolase
VRRGARPGKSQLALPGGFIQPNEPALEAAIRELREETRLKVPEPVLRGSLSAKEFFDDPYRSTRGRTFTIALRFDLRADVELPKVKGGDDAAEAFWMPLARLKPEDMFEDHYYIIQKMVGL